MNATSDEKSSIKDLFALKTTEKEFSKLPSENFNESTLNLGFRASNIVRQKGKSEIDKFAILLAAFNFILHKYMSFEKVVLRCQKFQDVEGENNLIDERVLYFDIDINSTFQEHITSTLNQLQSDSNKQNISDSSLLHGNILVHFSPLHGLLKKTFESDICLNILDKDSDHDGYKFNFKFKSYLFDPDVLKHFFNHMEYLIHQYDENFDKSLKNISLLMADEKQMMDACNKSKITGKEQYFTIVEMFEKAVSENQNADALKFGKNTYTYDQLNRKANKLARYFSKKYNLGAEDKVGLVLNKSDLMIIAILAVLKTGAAYVPIDPKYPEERINAILDELSPKLLVIDSDFMLNFTEFPDPVFVLDFEFGTIEEREDNLEATISGDGLAYIIYTSGSTGNPKGVMINHKSIANTLSWRVKFYNYDTSKNTLQIPSYAFDSSVIDIFATIVSGGTLIIPEIDLASDFEYFKNIVNEQKVNNFLIVPSFYQAILTEIKNQLDTLEFVTIAGESVAQSLVQDHFENYPKVRLINEYGPTENAVCTTAAELTMNENINIGKPIDNVQVYIVDNLMQRLPVGCVGEICLEGLGLSPGYLHNRQLTEKKFVDSPFNPGMKIYKTGDMGKYQSDGSIIFVGRVDQQIKIRGYRIELSEIENFLLGVKEVQGAVVLVKQYFDRSPFLVAYIKANQPIDENELKSILDKKLPKYMVPENFMFMKSFPLLPNGKIDRQTLLSMEKPRIKEIGGLPLSNTEKQLAEIWEEILDIKDVRQNDDFFNLGGHSLHLTQLIARTQKIFNVKLDYDFLFDHSLLWELANHIDALEIDFNDQEIPKAELKEFYDLSEQQRRFWFQSQFEENAMAHNMIKCYEMKGEFDIETLENAFYLLMERHEILRTAFCFENGLPKQKICNLKDVPFSVNVVNIEGKSGIDKHLEKAKNLKYELSSVPLFNVQLLKISKEESIFIFSLHHIIGDGWSLEIIAKEIFLLYEMIQNGKLDSLPPLHLQYKDYSEWQRKFINSEHVEISKTYWKNKLEGLNIVNTFAPDLNYTKISPKGALYSFALGRQNTMRLQDFASEYKVTLFHTMICTVKVLLFAFTNRKDTVIGTPHSGRHHHQLEDMIGNFLDIFIIRDVINKEDTFISLVKKVKNTVLKAFENKNYPFERIIDELQLPRSNFGNAGFETGISWQNYDELTIFKQPTILPGVALNNIQLNPIDLQKDVVKQSLWFFGTEKKFDLEFYIKYKTDLYSETVIETIVFAFNYVIKLILEHPETPIQDIQNKIIDKFKIHKNTYHEANKRISEEF